MAHEVQGYQYITFGWVMLWACFLIVLIRLYVRVYLFGHVLNRRSWRWAEIFVVVGWLLALGTNICNSIANDVNGNNLKVKMTDRETIIMLKAYWAWALFYKPAIYSMKAALLCFYTELINKEVHRKLWISIIVVAVLNGMGCASQILYIAFQCIPFSLNWNPEPWSDFCRGTLPYQIITLTGHTVTDLLVFILPFFIVKYAMEKLTDTQKKGAFVMFGLGFINLGIAIILYITRMIALGPNNVPTKWINASIDLLYTVQIATAIAIPCLPQIRMFYKKIVGHYKTGGETVSPAMDIGPTRKYSLSHSWSKSWGTRKGSTASRSYSRPSVAEGMPADGNWYKYWRPVGAISKPIPARTAEHPSECDDTGSEKSDIHNTAITETSTATSPRRFSIRYWRAGSDSRGVQTTQEAQSPTTEVPIDTV